MLIRSRFIPFASANHIKFTKNQKKLNNLIDVHLEVNQSKLVLVSGPAGSGKTMVLCRKAFQKIHKREFNKVVLTRPVVTCDEDIGYLPGDLYEKMDPWLKPFYDNVGEKTMENLLSTNQLEICPLAFMRGRTFDNTFVIADEMQNSTNAQMKMLLTRIGNNSMFVVSGDINQNDNFENGLQNFLSKLKPEHHSYIDIHHIAFDENDIMRNPLVLDILNIYNQ